MPVPHAAYSGSPVTSTLAKNMRLRLLASISCLFLAGCPAVDIKELDFTRTKPTIENLIGIWMPTDTTLNDIRERGHYPQTMHYLELRADHTFNMHNMPDWWSDGFGRSHGRLESLSGRWELTESKELWRIWEISLHTAEFITTIHLYHQKPPYQLFIRLGDPNEGDAMLFDRKATKPQK